MVNYFCVNFTLKKFEESKALAFYLWLLSHLQIYPRDKHKRIPNIASYILIGNSSSGSDPEDTKIQLLSLRLCLLSKPEAHSCCQTGPGAPVGSYSKEIVCSLLSVEENLNSQFGQGLPPAFQMPVHWRWFTSLSCKQTIPLMGTRGTSQYIIAQFTLLTSI